MPLATSADLILDICHSWRVDGACARGLDGVGDEFEDGAALHPEWLARMVGEDEHWVVAVRFLARPASPGVIRPLAADRPEHVPAHDRGADVRPPLLDRRRAGVGFAAHAAVAVHVLEFPEREQPLVQFEPADAERIFLVLVWPGDVPVEGRRDVQSELCRRPPVRSIR
jgi:hypothetical protein